MTGLPRSRRGSTPGAGPMGRLSDRQRETLLKGIQPHRVAINNKGMSYVEGYEVQAHLNRVFGFEGWDKEIVRLELLFESTSHDEKRNRSGDRVTYMCEMRITVRDPKGNLVKVTEE